MSETSILSLLDVTKAYEGAVRTEVLHGINLELKHGEFVALMGPSGSGKSTLLNIIGLLERATSGEVNIAGTEVSTLSDAELTFLRGRTLGFVFQFHHLVSALTVSENLMMPLAVESGWIRGDMRRAAIEGLGALGLAAHADKYPNQLSGGQQQRVAIARALMHRPPLVLADEPTGNLDTQTASEVLTLLRKYNQEQGVAFLLVTHDPRIAKECDRTIEIVDGRIAVADQILTQTTSPIT
jgi:lipoprotein-releasing system ATP-binding protein